MKIMWLCNMAPGAIRAVTGGAARGALWMDHVLNDLRHQQNVTLRILYAAPEAATGTLDETVSFASFAEREPHFYTKELEPLFVRELESFRPDIVHIWGTEYGHTLAMVNAAEKAGYLDQTVISIQGLCSVITKHYAEGIPFAVQRGNTFRDFVKHNSIRDQQKKFRMRGQMEIKALQKARHVIGRTDWDKACTTQLNPSVQYHFCNETLREEFYTGSWCYEKCQKHRIFSSSGEYPVKGLHYLLEALAIVARRYPDVEIYVGGPNPMPRKDKLEKLRYSVHSRYLKRLMDQYDLKDKVHFTGFLSADDFREELLQVNVFVLPSTIENSPNSMGEAMLLGVPCVASHVGGVAELLVHKKEGFVYQSTASYMLAHYIMEVFAMEEAAEEMGAAAKKHAMQTHSPEKNLERLMDIYRDISESTQK